jgi:hypothetical protein
MAIAAHRGFTTYDINLDPPCGANFRVDSGVNGFDHIHKGPPRWPSRSYGR